MATASAAFVTQSITLYSPGLGKKKIGSMSKEEAALIAVEEAPTATNTAIPVATAAQFARITGWVDAQPNTGEPKRSFRHRHSWSVFGGVRKNGVFVGYFQMCLAQSGF